MTKLKIFWLCALIALLLVDTGWAEQDKIKDKEKISIKTEQAPIRLSTPQQREKLKEKKEVFDKLPSPEDIDKMNTQEIKELLKKIVAIIKQ